MSYGTCTMCGCTDNNCNQCVAAQGEPCYWVDASHEICSRCYAEILASDGINTNIQISEVMNLPLEDLEFLKSFISKLDTFRDLVKHASPQWSSYRETVLMIRNTDLWIDAYIKKYPLLQEFRIYVLEEMKTLNISRHPEYIYKESNHFKGR